MLPAASPSSHSAAAAAAVIEPVDWSRVVQAPPSSSSAEQLHAPLCLYLLSRDVFPIQLHWLDDEDRDCRAPSRFLDGLVTCSAAGHVVRCTRGAIIQQIIHAMLTLQLHATPVAYGPLTVYPSQHTVVERIEEGEELRGLAHDCALSGFTLHPNVYHFGVHEVEEVEEVEDQGDAGH